jgi:uncharacterized membrane protein
MKKTNKKKIEETKFTLLEKTESLVVEYLEDDSCNICGKTKSYYIEESGDYICSKCINGLYKLINNK